VNRGLEAGEDPGVQPGAPTLVPFAASDGSLVLGWVTSAAEAEAEAWASLASWPAEPAVFERWHADPGVRPYIPIAGGRPAGYGELWIDPAETEAELARIVVDPACRGAGLGRRLVTLLAAEARRAGYDDVWLRVLPDNSAARSCYAAAGFVRATAAEEAAFNEGQPRPYVWMTLPRA
jgi:ribosomal protein S18 acetylase RimI-like enzyme